MDNSESKEEISKQDKACHAILDRRLQVLLDKPYLTEDEEVEIRNIKKEKLYYKDLMERITEEIKKGEGH